jgi:glyoxylase-like metal-dependent hydrolase (beta-lactamase superfamily II)/rhodanese-related sulfurtransferase
MKVEQIYTGCLAQGAYYIQSKNEAVIIDPLRETEPYIKKAEEEGAKIKYVLETHFHADFVSGHLDLAKKTGAEIVFGPNAKTEYDAHIAKDEEILEVGDVKIKVLHTPGHTMESTTYLLIDEDGNNKAIFTGDTLFIGDVGRPDLAVKTDLSREDLAGHLYESLHNKILPLEDNLTVYPGHGAGSACGKNMSSETTDTLGNQKKTNYALQDMSKEEFVKQVTEGLVPPPQYFPKNAVMNKKGYGSFDEVLEKGNVALDPDTFEDVVNAEGAIMLDVRSPEAYAEGHVPNSIFIGLDGSFAVWVGTLIPDLNQKIVLITEKGREEEAVTRLSRVGYDNTLGYLKGGYENWKASGKECDSVKSVSAEEFKKAFEAGKVEEVVDVRKESEYKSQHVEGEGVRNIPLDFINDKMEEYSQEKEMYLHCAGGYRSMITASILKSRGYHDLVNIEGGFDAIQEAGMKTSEYVCPSTML